MTTTPIQAKVIDIDGASNSFKKLLGQIVTIKEYGHPDFVKVYLDGGWSSGGYRRTRFQIVEEEGDGWTNL